MSANVSCLVRVTSMMSQCAKANPSSLVLPPRFSHRIRGGSSAAYCSPATAYVRPHPSSKQDGPWGASILGRNRTTNLVPRLEPSRGYTQAASTLTREQLHDLVYRLNEDERELLMNTLKQFESNKVKAKFEGQLAATVWRSRFGRPAKLKPVLGDVDPTGSYCAVPEDWLQKKFAETVPPPVTSDLMKLGLVNALPFIGFGFLDNFTMIIAGDYIEHTLGLFMCISTMAAAALGNTISDVIGIGSAFYVEKLAEMSGVKPPKMSPIQLEMKASRRAANLGRVLGITIGCLLGMCPLLFMKEDKDKEKSKDKAKAKDKEPTDAANVAEKLVSP
ncbi:transmembrane protein 65 [Anopheles ziemanni]|uniref:transmembrane protein 65 n=1 Tax=Anopheles coustani TaxID=139045 RepID=UPI002657FB82|nr:transmembrane protein 65 [Anopheles coustani]XP_058171475.1 transmembrane protein 65 [Anopheles ziemanni]